MSRLIHPETETYKFWKPEELERLKNLLGQCSFKEMEQFFPNRTKSGIQYKVWDLKWKSPYRHRLYTHNENYFSNINPLSCYWSGFLRADGYVGKKHTLEIQLAGEDYDHLEKLKNELEYSGPVRLSERGIGINGDIQIAATLAISGADKVLDDLKTNFNVTNLKTFFDGPPNFKNNYLNLCFALGYLDGDGFICLSNSEKSYNRKFTMSVCSSNLIMLNWIKDLFGSLTGKSGSIFKDKDKNCYNYCIDGYNALSIYDYLRHFPLPLLDRKWKQPRVLAFLEEKRQKYPNKFSQILQPCVKGKEQETV